MEACMSCCDGSTSDASGGRNGGGDRLERGGARRPFDHSATAWLIGQGVRHLNTADKEGELAYQRVVELLRRGADDLLDTVAALLRAQTGDAPLRWCLLHILSDAADAKAADFLLDAALEKLPERTPDEGCEGLRDAELLVRTMAVHGLRRIAGRHREAAEHLIRFIAQRPDRAILIEAVKLAGELRLTEKVREILPKEQHWMLDIRRARTEEVFVEPEREDGKERGFTPPRRGALYTAPHAACCPKREG
jgi:hypothetical protein